MPAPPLIFLLYFQAAAKHFAGNELTLQTNYLNQQKYLPIINAPAHHWDICPEMPGYAHWQFHGFSFLDQPNQLSTVFQHSSHPQVQVH